MPFLPNYHLLSIESTLSRSLSLCMHTHTVQTDRQTLADRNINVQKFVVSGALQLSF